MTKPLAHLKRELFQGQLTWHIHTHTHTHGHTHSLTHSPPPTHTHLNCTHLFRRLAENIAYTPSAPQAVTQNSDNTHEERVTSSLHVAILWIVTVHIWGNTKEPHAVRFDNYSNMIRLKRTFLCFTGGKRRPIYSTLSKYISKRWSRENKLLKWFMNHNISR